VIQTGILARAMLGDLLRAMIDVKAYISQVKCIDRGPASQYATRLDKRPYQYVPDTSRKCDTNTTQITGRGTDLKYMSAAGRGVACALRTHHGQPLEATRPTRIDVHACNTASTRHLQASVTS